MLEDFVCVVVVIDCDLTLNGDWIFRKGVCVPGSITVHNGSITVGENGYMISGLTRVENGDVIVENGGVWLNRNELVCRELTVRNGYFYNTAGLHEIDSIHVAGEFVNVSGWIDLEECLIHVEWGRFASLSNLYLHGCEITIEKDGRVDSFQGSYSIDSQCHIKNDGSLTLTAWEWQEQNMDVEIINRGEMHLMDGARFYGLLDNYGEIYVYGFIPVNGTLNNYGKIYNEGGSFYAENGEITGNSPINR